MIENKSRSKYRFKNGSSLKNFGRLKKLTIEKIRFLSKSIYLKRKRINSKLFKQHVNRIESDVNLSFRWIIERF
jgi:hypothetical protein